MLPYFDQPIVSLGPLHVSLFGVLVALGTVVGFRVALRRGEAAGESRVELEHAGWVAVLVGFPVSYAVLVVVERRDALAAGLWQEILSPPFGMSQIGGILGAFLGLCIAYARRKRRWWRVADALVQGVTIGFVFGRLGCTFAHDHPGRLTTIPLAFAYPGGARHDLGFYGFLLFLGVLAPASWWAHRHRPQLPGLQVALLATLYAPLRFLLDFLRARDLPGSDPRYGGLTFSQYACLGLLGFATWLWPRVLRNDLEGARPGSPPRALD